MLSNDEPDRGDRARAYLALARKSADAVNEYYERHSGGGFDPKKARELAVMNALLATAEMSTPEDPGMRLT